ncbi:MAG: sugar ABC transporter permease [Endomicrobia bacterium]|nr:sugar ABC transporter permease [Endomicrobiia bacterium]
MVSDRRYLNNFFYVLPAILMFAIFTIYPFIKTFQLSVYEWDGISPTMKFVGLKNYLEIFSDRLFWNSMLNAGIITLLALTFQNMLALLLAVIIDRGVKFDKFFRTVYFIPPILSGVVVGLVWKWIYDGNYGILNTILTHIGLEKYTTSWLSNPRTASVSVAVVHMWKGFGWGFVILLAGLQTIPRELYEAAAIDGADSFKQFWYVTAPLMLPIFFVVSVLTILGTMQIFDLIYSMTRGGPAGATEVPISYIYRYMANNELGYATAMAVIFGLVLFTLSILQIKISRKLRKV